MTAHTQPRPLPPPTLADYIRAAIAEWHADTGAEMTVGEVAEIFAEVLGDLEGGEDG